MLTLKFIEYEVTLGPRKNQRNYNQTASADDQRKFRQNIVMKFSSYQNELSRAVAVAY